MIRDQFLLDIAPEIIIDNFAGGDGDTMLRDLVPEEEPTRDTRTIDMFEGVPA